MDKRKKNRVIQKKKRKLLKDLRGRYSKGSRGRPQNRYSKGSSGRPQNRYSKGSRGRPQNRYSKGSRGRPQNRYSKGKRGGVRKEGFQNRKVYKRPLLNGRIVLLLFLMYLLIEKSNI
tara:strand:- start:10569 stop:10922 length:354 start_codon:yes stop_codon:yes gene_type:complete